MNFSLEKSLEVLERTPNVLNAMLKGISFGWISSNEGGETWSVTDVLGHLIHGEKTDWIPRTEIILSGRTEKKFEPFDPGGQRSESKGKSADQLLSEFQMLRGENLKILRSRKISSSDLEEKGIHPEFGTVSLSQLLSTWAVHDLNHIHQISRVMANHYRVDVGPWTKYLRILHM
jgi:hypothetical protein